MSEDRIVWISAASGVGWYEDLRWHWSPRAQDPSGIVVHDGPPVGSIDSPRHVQVGGDWAVTDGCTRKNDASSCMAFVWRMSTGETWALPQREGRQWIHPLAISDEELVLGEQILALNYVAGMNALVRIEPRGPVRRRSAHVLA